MMSTVHGIITGCGARFFFARPAPIFGCLAELAPPQKKKKKHARRGYLHIPLNIIERTAPGIGVRHSIREERIGGVIVIAPLVKTQARLRLIRNNSLRSILFDKKSRKVRFLVGWKSVASEIDAGYYKMRFGGKHRLSWSTSREKGRGAKTCGLPHPKRIVARLFHSKPLEDLQNRVMALYHNTAL